MDDKRATTVEEIFGRPVDEVRAEFRREFRRLKEAINGYEMISVLRRLSRGTIGRDPYSNARIICYWKEKAPSTSELASAARGKDARHVYFEVDEGTFDALLRAGLIQSIGLSVQEARSLGGSQFYDLTAMGEKFLSRVPSKYQSGEPWSLLPGSDTEFWTVIIAHESENPPAVYPWIAEETPNATEVLNYYEAFAAVNENVRVSGPHSLRWIPRAAFALDQFPVLEGKVGERIVRSWFDTVMNPILKNLRFEQSLLESRNWTWRVPPGRIELIRPVAESPYGVSTDNLGQFASVSFFTFAGELIDRHDTELLKLEAECKELNALLSRSKVLEQALKTAAEDNSTSAEGGTVNSVLLRGSVEEHLELLAQYIVNTTNELPGYNVYSVVWAKHRIRFLAALEDPLVTAARDSVLHAGRTLLNTSVELIDFLVKVRDRLSLQFDIPIVRSQNGQE